ncbi:MAG: prephenate dehydratase [Solirubrobacterales bacterium]
MNTDVSSTPRRIGHLGPPGTHGEEALRAALGGHAASAEMVALDSNGDVVRAVESGEVDAGFVPIENSIEGAVTETLDALVHDAPRVRIVGEVIWPAHHALIAADDIPLEEIAIVTSHPQALAQCAGFIKDSLPCAERLAQVSTAGAVRHAVLQGGGYAAIGSRIAAEIYGGVVLAEQIEDVAGNKTRFVWLAREEFVPPWAGENDAQTVKTSLVFSGFNDTSPGGLVSILDEFAKREVNMSKIESRPERTSLGHYLFFVDLDGSAEDAQLAAAIEAVRAKVKTLRVLGSFEAFEA